MYKPKNVQIIHNSKNMKVAFKRVCTIHQGWLISEEEDIKWNISPKLLFLLASSVQMSAHKSRAEMSGDLTSGLN